MYPEVFAGSSGQGSENGSNFGAKWGWYQHIHTIAGGDFFKIGDATKANIHEALMFLGFTREFNDEQIKNIKKANGT